MIKELFKKAHATIGYNLQLTISKEKIKYIVPAKTFNDDCFKDLFATKSTTTLKGGEKIYFIPNCILPRFKLNKIKEADFISVVKNIKSADVIVYNENAIDKLISKKYSYYIQCEDYTPIIKEKIIEAKEDNPNISTDKIKDVLDLTIEHPNDFIDLDWWMLSTEDRSRYNGKQYWTIKEAHLELLDFLVSTDKPFIQDKELQKYISNAVTIDEKGYEEISEMLESSDNNNSVLAIELMANCDYETSLVYLLFLLKNHGTTLKYKKECSHVNFKSLLEFLNTKRNWYYLNIDHIIQILSDHKQINKENMDIVLALGKKDDSIRVNTNSDYFIADVITPTEELQKAMEKGCFVNDEEKEEEDVDDDDDDENETEDYPF